MSIGKMIDQVSSNIVPITGGFATGVVAGPLVLSLVKKMSEKRKQNEQMKRVVSEDNDIRQLPNTQGVR
jgi:hypothetical protein